jgi:hypothetical protein
MLLESMPFPRGFLPPTMSRDCKLFFGNNELKKRNP